jgi:hypothetical protein
MNEFLRDRIMRKLESLSDERLYQVLDYVEFLESKYAERQAPSANVFTRFAENVEDRLRAGRVSATTIAETMNLMNRAVGVLGNVAAAGKSVASDLYDAAASVTASAGSTGSTTPSGGAPGTTSGSAEKPAGPAAPPSTLPGSVQATPPKTSSTGEKAP